MLSRLHRPVHGNPAPEGTIPGPSTRAASTHVPGTTTSSSTSTHRASLAGISSPSARARHAEVSLVSSFPVLKRHRLLLVWLVLCWCSPVTWAASEQAAGVAGFDLAKSNVTEWTGDPKVLLVHTAAGLIRAHTAHDMADLIKDNLEPDLAHHTKRERVTGRDLQQLLQQIGTRARLKRSTVAILVRGSKITAITYRQFLNRFQHHVEALVESLRHHMATDQLHLPDTLLLFNTRDEALCQRWKGVDDPCSALPVFSHHKEWDWQHNSSLQRDVLVPYFIHSQDHLVWYEPKDKLPVALLRAGLHQQMNESCCRYQLSLLASSQGSNSTLDAGIVSSTWVQPLPFPQVPFVELEEHARWQYLLSCDGNSASARLGKLLAINSVVLKQRSPYLEWYYRSLQPGVHYLDFDPQDVMQVLQQHSQPSQLHKAMPAAANTFAYRYLGSLSRAVYWTEAIQRYNALFKPGVLQRLLEALPAHVTSIEQLDELLEGS